MWLFSNVLVGHTKLWLIEPVFTRLLAISFSLSIASSMQFLANTGNCRRCVQMMCMCVKRHAVFEIFSQFSAIKAVLWTWMNRPTMIERRKGEKFKKKCSILYSAPCCRVPFYKVPFCWVLNACVRVWVIHQWTECVLKQRCKECSPRAAPIENGGFATGIRCILFCLWRVLLLHNRIYQTYVLIMIHFPIEWAKLPVCMHWLIKFLHDTRDSDGKNRGNPIFCHRFHFFVVGGIL